MPFVALHADTGTRIDITKCIDPRAELDKDKMVCPLCEGKMLIRGGIYRRTHFAHRVNTDACDWERLSHPESPEHLAGKEAVAEYLQKRFPEATVTLERIVRNGEGKIVRIADVFVMWPNGHVVIGEVQLAKITPEQLEQRTYDYLACGYDAWWCLGKDAATDTNLSWVKRLQWEVATVIFDNGVVAVKKIDLGKEQHESHN